MLMALLHLVLVPLFVNVASELFAEWLIRKYFDKSDKKQQPECLGRMDTKKHVDWYSTCFYNALGCSTLSLFDYLTGLIFCQIGERERSLEGDFFDEKIQVAGGLLRPPIQCRVPTSLKIMLTPLCHKRFRQVAKINKSSQRSQKNRLRGRKKMAFDVFCCI